MGIATVPSGQGYRLVTSTASVFGYGNLACAPPAASNPGPTGGTGTSADATPTPDPTATPTPVPTVTPTPTPTPVPPSDRDGDGVPDTADRCATLAGTAQRNGCPRGLSFGWGMRYVSSGRAVKVRQFRVFAPKGAKIVVSCSRGCRTGTASGRGAKAVTLKPLAEAPPHGGHADHHDRDDARAADGARGRNRTAGGERRPGRVRCDGARLEHGDRLLNRRLRGAHGLPCARCPA